MKCSKIIGQRGNVLTLVVALIGLGGCGSSVVAPAGNMNGRKLAVPRKQC